MSNLDPVVLYLEDLKYIENLLNSRGIKYEITSG